MSIKRILGITIFGVLFIAAVIGFMLLASYLRRDNEPIPLPDTSPATQPTVNPAPDALDRVEVSKDNLQAVVSTLNRPEIYSRDMTIETYWEDGQAEYSIRISVAKGITSMSIIPPDNHEKRIIVTSDTLYIWYRGERTPYSGLISDTGDAYATADEWQMLVTYEDILRLDPESIIEAEYTELDGADCIYAQYRSELLGYVTKCYISIELGLVISAEEYDETGALVYNMSAGECVVGETDPAAFTLPDGTDLLAPSS